MEHLPTNKTINSFNLHHETEEDVVPNSDAHIQNKIEALYDEVNDKMHPANES